MARQHTPLILALSRANAQQPGPPNPDGVQEHKKISEVIKAVRGWRYKSKAHQVTN